MKAVQVIKYILMVADIVAMAGLCYAGIKTFLNLAPFICTTSELSGNWSCFLDCSQYYQNCDARASFNGSVYYLQNTTCNITQNSQNCTGTILVEGTLNNAYNVTCIGSNCTTPTSKICTPSTIIPSLQDVILAVYYL
jgi:hypothetical protein